MNLISQPGGSILAIPQAYATERTQVFIQGSWKTSSTYAQALDIAADGTAIGRNHNNLMAPICLNGKWTDITRTAPMQTDVLAPPPPWHDDSVALLDTTPGGWILARRGIYPDEYAVMLPIKVDGVDPSYAPPPVVPNVPPVEPPEYLAGGVDRISMMAGGGTGHVPEMWIMAPYGGTNPVRFRSPVNEIAKLKLQCAKVIFSPDTLDAKDMNIQISGNDTQFPLNQTHAPTEDLQPVLKLGGTVDSLSVPIKIKVMKKRVVKVALHKVFGIGATGAQTRPQYMPEKAAVEDYLNEVYGRQVNTTFIIVPFVENGPHRAHPEEEGIDFDLDHNHKIEVQDNSLELAAATPNAKAGIGTLGINIDVWVIDGDTKMISRGPFRDERVGGSQFGGDGVGKVIIDGSLNSVANLSDAQKPNFVLHTIAHEIGHVMVGRGHPDAEVSSKTVVLNWDGNGGKDPYVLNRLMCSGNIAGYKILGKCLLKKEWDNIEGWLHANVDTPE